MQQIHLFYGKNHFALRQEKMRWIREFRQKHGDENLLRLDSDGVSGRMLIDEVSIAPFISKNRLVVMEGVFRCAKEDAKSLSSQIHPGVVLLFAVPLDPSGRVKFPAGMKDIEKIANCREFPLLSRSKLCAWIDSVCMDLGSSVAPEARDLLLEISGNDQDMLLQELNKLSVFSGGGTILKSHVLSLAVAAGEMEVWRLLDLLGRGQVEEGILYAKSLMERGDEPQSLWSRLLWSLAQLVLVWAAAHEGITSPELIASSSGVPFLTARSLLPCARRLDRESLMRVVDLFSRMDIDLKTGVLKASSDDSQEIKAVIDRCLMEFAGTKH